MLKMSRTELHTLLVGALPLPPAETPLPDRPRRAQALPPRQPRVGPEYQLLVQALPSLWNKAQQAPGTTVGIRHRKLRELVLWWFEKHGYRCQRHVPVQYWDQHTHKDGRTDLVVTSAADRPVLALEIDWELQIPSLRKLQAWSLRGVPVAWIAAAPCLPAGAARVYADRVLGQATTWWLPLVELRQLCGAP